MRPIFLPKTKTLGPLYILKIRPIFGQSPAMLGPQANPHRIAPSPGHPRPSHHRKWWPRAVEGGSRLLCSHCRFSKIALWLPRFFYSHFGPFQDTRNLSNYTTKALRICTSHFILKTSKKLSFGPPSGKFRILHLGPFDRFDFKLICFNLKLLNCCSTHRTLVLKTLR